MRPLLVSSSQLMGHDQFTKEGIIRKLIGRNLKLSAATAFPPHPFDKLRAGPSPLPPGAKEVGKVAVNEILSPPSLPAGSE